MKEQATKLEQIEENIYQAGRKLNSVIKENYKFQAVGFKKSIRIVKGKVQHW